MPKSAKSTRAGSEFGGSQIDCAASYYTYVSSLPVKHSKEDTCKSCREWKGSLAHVMWKTCLNVDFTVETCGNRPRRGGTRGGSMNLCRSCQIKATRDKRSYAKKCQNPNFYITNCLETPLVATDGQAAGSRREGVEDVAQGGTMSGTMDGADEVVDEEFAGLMRDLETLEPTGRSAVPNDWDGSTLGSMGGPGNPDDYGAMIMELNDLDPHNTVAEPSGGIVDFMTYFDRHVTEHGTLCDP